MDYERGLELLKEQARASDWYQNVLPYESRLLEIVQDEQLYGLAPQTSQEKQRVVNQLNRLCLQHLPVSFNDLCRGITPVPTAPPDSLELLQPGTAVCFYARQDESFYRKLQDALSLWQHRGKISWLETRAGDNVAITQQRHMHQANLVLLLYSSSFFAEPACYKLMIAALQEHVRRKVPVVPILVRACNWKASECGNLEVLPENTLPVNEWAQPDQAYENIRQGLLRLLSPT
jgi:hypothetical protein